MTDAALDLDPDHASPLEAIAHAAHEAHRAYSRFIDATYVKPAWDTLKQEDKDLVIAIVYNVMHGASPDTSHDRWVEQRSAEGWTYGPLFNSEERITPWLLPWEDLPTELRALNTVTYHAVWAMLATLNEAAGVETGSDFASPEAFAQLMGMGAHKGHG